jgi:hypothetical protein
VLTLSKFENPDLSSFNDPEVYFRVPLDYHAGLIVKSCEFKRVRQLIDDYTDRLSRDFSTVVDAPEVKKFH